MPATPQLAGDLVSLAREHVDTHPGLTTAELLAHLAPHTETTRLAVIFALHRSGRSLGFGQDDDHRWYTAEANEQISSRQRDDRGTRCFDKFQRARAALELVVRAGRSAASVDPVHAPSLIDAGVRVHDRPALLGDWFTPEQRVDVLTAVRAPYSTSDLDTVVLATPRAAVTSVRHRLLEAGRRDLAMVLDPEEFAGHTTVW